MSAPANHDTVRPTKAERDLRKHLTSLTKAVREHLGALDHLMRQPSTVERGRAIAALCNALEFANDSARRFGLGIDLSTGKPERKR
jgi:hypothetical protein